MSEAEMRGLELRPDDKGEFDELIATFDDGLVHIETMDTDSCYAGFYWDDGRYCQLWFGVKGKKLWYNHDHGTGEPPRFTAQGVDRKPWMNASAIEAPSGGETTKIGSTEGESAVPEGETPR